MNRTISQMINGSPGRDGAGVNLTRMFGYHNVKLFDPFLMMDYFDSKNSADYVKGFPWHPHRGIETVTYLISGKIEHEDSLGNKGVIQDGDCQWMTAGSGILHQEMPQPSPHMHGIQLWVNLPSTEKMTAPKYRDFLNRQMPVLKGDGYEAHIIAGSLEGREGLLEGMSVEPLFFDLSLDSMRSYVLPVQNGRNGFVFCVEGQGMIENEVFEKASIALLSDGDQLEIIAGKAGCRVFVVAGKPLSEPIAWGGPIVMNTREELNLAFMELEKGTFIKKNAQIE